MILEKQDTLVPYDLGDGLRLRFATVEDSEALAQFNGRIHANEGFNEFVSQWTREFVSPSHPTCGPNNVTLVEDTRTRQIVSSMCLIPQTWTFDGIPFPVGRPEAVGTAPAYRRRGLIRAQFDVLHAKSEREGHLVQGITGIPWYYRQFGYEYAIDLDGGRCVYPTLIPALKAGESEAYRFRPATVDDLPLMMDLYDRDCARSLIACPRSEAEWRRMTFDVPSSVIPYIVLTIIETNEGRAVGVIRTSRELSWRGMFPVRMLAVVEGQSWRAVLPAALRWLKTQSEAAGTAAQKSETPTLHFEMGEQHPAYDAAPELFHQNTGSYAWYIRVPDVPKFINHIAPVLEQRLARSALNGYAGEIKVREYVRGFKLIIEPGKISAEPWTAADQDEGDASFPPWTFVKLLFGQRSFEELEDAYPDCFANAAIAPVLKALFPKRFSNVLPIG
ncbi:MAG TPA: GNAT family N-acetyltransferase [Anaerolineae bacterium]|nr:GNAT family N-acetyltransferase [Anaerolineae bacterium]